MALKTRFISTSSTPTGSSPFMDPGAASAAQRAASSASDQIFRSVAQIGVALQQQEEKPDDLYIAQAKGDFQIQFNDQYIKASSQIQPGGNFSQTTDELFYSSSAPFLDNAPNEATRRALEKSFLTMRPSAIGRAQALQFKTNEAYALNSFNDFAQRATALSALGKAGEEATYRSLEEMAAASISRGYDSTKISSAVDQAKQQVWMQSRLADTYKDPFTTLRDAESGAFVDYGPKVQETLIKAAQARIGGMVKDYTAQADKALDAVYAGRPADENFTNSLNAISNLFEQTKDPGLLNKLHEMTEAAEYEQQVRGLSPADLERQYSKNQLDFVQGKISKEQLSKFDTLVSNKVKWLNKDPLSYYELENATTLVPDLPTKQTPPQEAQASIDTRRRLASEAASIVGKPVPTLRSSDVIDLFNRWDSMTVREQQETLGMLSSFGPEFAGPNSKLIGEVAKEFPNNNLSALAPAMGIMNFNPNLSKEIIVGMDHLNRKNVSVDLQLVSPQQIYADVLGDLYIESPELRQQMFHAARAVAANRLNKNPKLDHAELLKETLKEVSQVKNVSQRGAWWGSYKIVSPVPGMDDGDLNSVLQDLNVDGILEYGNGVPRLMSSSGELKDLTDDDLAYFQYRSVGGGEYILTNGDSALLNEDGSVFSVNLRNYILRNHSQLVGDTSR